MYLKRFINKIIFSFYIFIAVNFQHSKNYFEQIFARLVGPILLFTFSSYKAKTTNSTTLIAFRKTNDVPCEDANAVASADLSHVDSIIRHNFKTNGLDTFEYHTSFEMKKRTNII